MKQKNVTNILNQLETKYFLLFESRKNMTLLSLTLSSHTKEIKI